MPDDFQSEIDSMIASFDGTGEKPAEPAKQVEPAKSKEPAELVEPAAKEPAAKESAEPVEPAKPAKLFTPDPREAKAVKPVEPAEPAEPEKLEGPDEATLLRKHLESISSFLLEKGIPFPSFDDAGAVAAATAAAASKAQPAASAPAAAPVAQAMRPEQLLGDLDKLSFLDEGLGFDDFINSREVFEKNMRRAFKTAQEHTIQQVLGYVPSIVGNQVRQMVALNRAVEEFYRDNEDLLPVRSVVGAVSNQVTAEHPDWSLKQVLDESNERSRKILRMPKISEKGGDKVVRPTFAKSGSSSAKGKASAVAKTELQQEIDELLD
jgi:hypothetical protein